MAGERERDRYGHQSWRERLAEIPAGIRAHPRIALVAAVFIVGWAIMLLLRPTYVTLDDVAAGDCLYIRPNASVDEFAERASCTVSHSHEVLSVAILGAAGDAFPEIDALSSQGEACAAALAAITGEAGADPTLTTSFVSPSEPAWAAGVRRGACLAHRVDGGFLTAPVSGG